MTALDQAFIKAFAQQGSPAATISPLPPTPASSPSPPAPSRASDILATLEQTPLRQKADGARCKKNQTREGVRAAGTCAWEQAECDVGPTLRPAVPSVCGSWVADRGPWTVYTEAPAFGGWTSIGSEADWAAGQGENAEYETRDAEDHLWSKQEGAEAEAPSPESRFSASTAAPDAAVPVSDFPTPAFRQPEPQVAGPELQVASPAPRCLEFRPAWQVDRFCWPRVCRRLMARAADEWDRLADAMLAANTRGQKVLAFAGCRRGEGATTLLLCVARRLAERGIKAVLVDADLARPRLAKRLGIQPQLGWAEIAEQEDAALDQAVVEATANNLALLAIREPDAAEGRSVCDRTRLASWIPTLKEHYEMVLVDLGPLENAGLDEDRPCWTAGGTLDAVLLVHNQHVTSEEQLSEAERRLAAAKITVAGVIENCAAQDQ